MNVRSTLQSLFTASAVVIAGGAAAQQPFTCGQAEARQKLMATDPHLQEREADYEHGLQAYLQARAGLRDVDDTTTYIIPIVFHILYDEGDGDEGSGANLLHSGFENISDAQIFDQVRVLNNDYQKLNSDTSAACCGFDTIIANLHVKFQLATKDPYGNCTNGIDRIHTLRTIQADEDSKFHPWLRERYLNVWVVRSIGDAGVAGYAYYPTDVQNGVQSLRDGVLILHDYIGTIGTSQPGHSRALTHEIGHWMSLWHVWGNSNAPGQNDPQPLPGHLSTVCGDDQVDDTPLTRGWSVCPTPAQSKNCDPNIFENYQNYMDYSYCSMMFTEGQKARMRAVLNNPVSGRNQIWTEATHQFSGIAGYEMTCGPEADFYVNYPFICRNVPVSFHDNSHNAAPTSWSWTFEGGNPGTSNEQNPVVTFDQPGPHATTLVASNDHGSSSRTETKVYVAPDYSEVEGLLYEPFDQHNGHWPVVNRENNQTWFDWNSSAGHYGAGCIKLNSSQSYSITDPFATGAGDIDELITPSLDLSHVSGIGISFWYAYATQTSTLSEVNEIVKIFSSVDCGQTWKPVTITSNHLQGAALITAGVAPAGYVPQASEWRQFNVPLTVSQQNGLKTQHVRIKIAYTSGDHSNDFFLDDVNISGTVGITETAAQLGGMTLMPNPATDHLSVSIDLGGSSKGTISFLDMTGRTVFSQAVGANDQQLEYDLGKLGMSSGVYLVRLSHDGNQRVERLVVR